MVVIRWPALVEEVVVATGTEMEGVVTVFVVMVTAVSGLLTDRVLWEAAERAPEGERSEVSC